MSGEGQELRCQEVVELLTAYLEDTMPPAERVALEQHLLDCRGCLSYLEQLRTTIRLTGRLRLTEEAVPPQTMASLLAAFRAWRPYR